MTHPTTITVDLLKLLRADMDAALAAVAAKHGIAIKAGRATYTAETATFKVDVAVLQGGAAASDPHATMKAKARSDWNRSVYLDGLPRDALGGTFVHRGVTYTIEGLLPRNTKMPILVSCNGGTSLVKISAEVVLRSYKAPAAAAA